METKNVIQISAIAIGLVVGGAVILSRPASAPPNIAPTPSASAEPTPAPIPEPVLARVGDTIAVGNFVYVIERTVFKKEFNDALQAHRADGIFLGIFVKVTNRSKETRILDRSLFYVLNSSDMKYEASDAGSYLPNNIMLKQIHPGITTKGLLVFEVPNKTDKYALVLTGGIGENISAQVALND